jgi:hypothetical protein
VQTESKDVISLQSHAFQIRSKIKVLQRRTATTSLVQRALFATLEHGGKFTLGECAACKLNVPFVAPLLCTKSVLSGLIFLE